LLERKIGEKKSKIDLSGLYHFMHSTHDIAVGLNLNQELIIIILTIIGCNMVLMWNYRTFTKKMQEYSYRELQWPNAIK